MPAKTHPTPKVLFLTEGSKEIGFGHITRCLSLAQAFKEKADIESYFVIDGDEVAFNFFSSSGFGFQIADWKPRVETFLKNFPIVVVDSYKAPLSVYEKISQHAKVKLFIDDYHRLDYPDGLILNFTVRAKEFFPSLAEKYPNSLLGEKYHLLRKPFWEVEEKIINPNVETVLITFGGDDFRNMTPKVLKLVLNFLPEVKKIKTVIGGGFKNRDQIEEIASKNPKVELIFQANAQEMKQLMVEADLAISACGQTLYELARVGTPTVGIAVAQNQKFNVLGFTKAGFLKFAGWYNENDLEEKIKKALREIQNREIRQELSELGRKLIDGKGPQRIVKAVIKNLSSL